MLCWDGIEGLTAGYTVQRAWIVQHAGPDAAVRGNRDVQTGGGMAIWYCTGGAYMMIYRGIMNMGVGWVP